MSATPIQWTEHTLNPLRYGRGHYCQKISPGCANCYASRMQPRFGNAAFPGTGGDVPELGGIGGNLYGQAGKLWLDTGRLHEVLTRKPPTLYFWCDMTDIFSAWWPDEWLDACFATMALTHWHTHQVLTKRPERARSYLLSRSGPGGFVRLERAARAMGFTMEFEGRPLIHWPLPNVWLGISCEDQQRADERDAILQDVPAAVRFWSAEPLLGLVRIRPFCPACRRHCLEGSGYAHCCDVPVRYPHWVIVGGESGTHRPCHLNHVRTLVQQCAAAGVACFVKQLGACPVMDADEWRALQPRPPLAARNHEYAPAGTVPLALTDRKGGDPEEWPADLRVRQWPAARRALATPAG